MNENRSSNTGQRKERKERESNIYLFLVVFKKLGKVVVL